MFVRWQTYRSQARRWNTERALLKAILVESIRVEGKPRQKHIAFLGSMSVDRSDMRRFWHEVTARFDQLGNRVGPDERARLLASIAERVEAVRRRSPSLSNSSASASSSSDHPPLLTCERHDLLLGVVGRSASASKKRAQIHRTAVQA